MSDPPRVIVVTGVQGAGKSTIGRLLAERFDPAAFIEADDLQRMIVSGGVGPLMKAAQGLSWGSQRASCASA